MLFQVFFLSLLTAISVSGSVASKNVKNGRRLEPVPSIPEGPTTGVFLNVDADATGPVKIILTADIMASENNNFDAPTIALQKPDGLFPLRQMNSAGCSVAAAVPSCGGNLSLCLANDVKNMSSVCSCYGAHASCWATAGCPDSVPKKDADYCTYSLKCPLSVCAGSGAWTLHANAGVIFALLISSIAAALLG